MSYRIVVYWASSEALGEGRLLPDRREQHHLRGVPLLPIGVQRQELGDEFGMTYATREEAHACCQRRIPHASGNAARFGVLSVDEWDAWVSNQLRVAELSSSSSSSSEDSCQHPSWTHERNGGGGGPCDECGTWIDADGHDPTYSEN